MSLTIPPHFNQNSQQTQEKGKKDQTARGDLRQDKRQSPAPLPASAQADAGTKIFRAVTPDTNPPRSQERNGYAKRTAKLTLWVEPIVKERLRRKAERDKLSVSSVGAAGLKLYLQQDADIDYTATLGPLIAATIDRRMAARENRLALLLVRNSLAAEQTRSIATNLLGRHPDITPDVLNDILDKSLQDAKKKLTRRSPELEELIKEVKSWLSDLSGYRQDQEKKERKP
jgi:hypothetical protein